MEIWQSLAKLYYWLLYSIYSCTIFTKFKSPMLGSESENEDSLNSQDEGQEQEEQEDENDDYGSERSNN